MTLLKFRENLMRSLLLGVPFEKLKTGLGQKPISQMKHQLVDHQLEKKNLIAMFKDAVLAATRKLVGSNEESKKFLSRL